MSETEQETLVEDEPPDNACIYYGTCGNELPSGAEMICPTCLGLARHKDKLGAYYSGDLLAFTDLVYRIYDDPSDVMEALHEKGATEFVQEIRDATRGT